MLFLHLGSMHSPKRDRSLLGFFRLFGTMTLSLAMIITNARASYGQALQIGPGLPAPAPITGASGGQNNSGDCGHIAIAPNVVLQVTGDLPFMRIHIQTEGAPTMLVQGPTGRFCVLPDSAGSGIIEMSGFASKGTYSIFVGDRAQGTHPFSLSISPNRN